MVSLTYSSSNQKWVSFFISTLKIQYFKLFFSIFSSFSDVNMITSLDQMNHLADRKIAELAIQNADQLKTEILKGQNTLIGARKKSYFRTLFGTLLYDLSVLFGVGNRYYIYLVWCLKNDARVIRQDQFSTTEHSLHYYVCFLGRAPYLKRDIVWFFWVMAPSIQQKTTIILFTSDYYV